MNDKIVDSNNQDPDNGNPTPEPASDPGTVDENIQTDVNSLPTGAALAELVKNDTEASEILRRSNQSDKDKGYVEAKKAADQAVKIALKALEAQGVKLTENDIEDMNRNVFIDNLRNQTGQTQDPTPQPTNSAPQDGVILQQDAVRQANLMLGPEVSDAVREKVLSSVSTRVFLTAASLQQAVTGALLAESKVPETNDASLQTGQNDAGGGDADQTALRVAYDAEIATLGKSNPDAVMKVRDKHIAQGLKFY